MSNYHYLKGLYEGANSAYQMALVILPIILLLRLFFDISRGWFIIVGILWLWGLYDATKGMKEDIQHWEVREELVSARWRGISAIISLAIIFVLTGPLAGDNYGYYLIWWIYYLYSTAGKTGYEPTPRV